MTYNPFKRGPWPVGVRTIQIDDSERAQTLTVEIWYPAAERYRGQDLDPATRDQFTIDRDLPEMTQDAVRDAAAAPGRFPLVQHNHGAFGTRRINSALATHLASHGYVVAGHDVPGNTLGDLMDAIRAARRGEAPSAFSRTDVFEHRFAYASLVIERLIAGADPEIAGRIDAARVGAFGQSAGGWTSLGVNQINRRLGATFAMEPLWGRRSPLPGLEMMGNWLKFADWNREVPTFLLAGELDPLIILQDLRELYERLPAPKRFASLRGAGHWHMSDNAEFAHELFRHWYLTDFPDSSFDRRAVAAAMRPFSELCPAEPALDTIRALCLAHMDSHLKGSFDAHAFLDTDLTATFAARGIALDEVTSSAPVAVTGVI